MRTFHQGGVTGGADIVGGLPRVQELFEARIPRNKAPIADAYEVRDKPNRARRGTDDALFTGTMGFPRLERRPR